MTPATGDTNTEFTFSVDYSQPDDELPDSIQVVIDGVGYDMTLVNGSYEYSTKLSEGNHTYYFTTTLGEFTVDTGTSNTGYVAKPEGQPEDGDGDDDGEDNTMLFAIFGIIVVVIVVLVLLFVFVIRKKKGQDESVVEQPSAPEERVIPEDPVADQPPTPAVQPQPEESVPQPPPVQPIELPTSPTITPQPLVTSQATPAVEPPTNTEEQYTEEELEE
jgi:LPXTG-motif cell wall-anchored protein